MIAKTSSYLSKEEIEPACLSARPKTYTSTATIRENASALPANTLTSIKVDVHQTPSYISTHALVKETEALAHLQQQAAAISYRSGLQVNVLALTCSEDEETKNLSFQK